MQLFDQVAIIVGGSSGMGAATARRLSAEGATVVIADIDEAGAKGVVHSIQEEFPERKAFSHYVDVSCPESVSQLKQFVADQVGPVEILVNTFGIAEFVPMLELTWQAWQRDISVNLSGFFLTCHAFGSQMVQSGSGKIVNFGSSASLSGVPGMVHYTASKHGVLGLTRALAVEWAKHNVRVNCICPGATTTTMMLNATTEAWREQRKRRIPTGQMSTPESQAEVVLFLVSSASQNLTGAAIPTDGGAQAMTPATSTDALWD